MNKHHYHLLVTETAEGVTLPCARLVNGQTEEIQNCVMCPQFLEAYKGLDNKVLVTCTWPKIARGKKNERHA